VRGGGCAGAALAQALPSSARTSAALGAPSPRLGAPLGRDLGKWSGEGLGLRLSWDRGLTGMSRSREAGVNSGHQGAVSRPAVPCGAETGRSWCTRSAGGRRGAEPLTRRGRERKEGVRDAMPGQADGRGEPGCQGCRKGLGDSLPHSLSSLSPIGNAARGDMEGRWRRVLAGAHGGVSRRPRADRRDTGR